MKRPERLTDTHLAYFLEARGRLRAGNIAWEFFQAVVIRDLELPDGTQIKDDGSLSYPLDATFSDAAKMSPDTKR